MSVRGVIVTLEARDMTEDAERGQQPISLVIPCRAEHIGLCRLLAGVVGAREAMQAEDIADLKLVVTEACTCFLWGFDGSAPPTEETGARQSPSTLRVDFAVQPGSWEVTVSDPEHRHHILADGRSDPLRPEGLGLTIIRALVDTVEHTDTKTEGSVIRLVKRLSPRSTDLR
jgi:anti-sigma regulatory factor (Ser/Thr protein kinase)